MASAKPPTRTFDATWKALTPAARRLLVRPADPTGVIWLDPDPPFSDTNAAIELRRNKLATIDVFAMVLTARGQRVHAWAKRKKEGMR